MRADLNKVLTEQPRRGSDSPNLKTRARFKNYDDAREDRYSLPKIGKMLMGNRDLGPHDESKDFTASWVRSSVGLILGLDGTGTRFIARSNRLFPTRINKIITCSIRT